jgi:hypothetical protein
VHDFVRTDLVNCYLVAVQFHIRKENCASLLNWHILQIPSQDIRTTESQKVLSIQYVKYVMPEKLKGLGHEIIIRFKWYGLIGLGLEKVRQVFIIFLTVSLILN